MSLQSLQAKLGLKVDGNLGPVTLRKAMEFFKLTPECTAHFFGQTSHETGGFSTFTENLNYSAKGLQTTFGKYFPGTLEENYTRQPERIANRVYANRMGNGDENSGDGWKYIGRGALQTTGKDNYTALSKHLQVPNILIRPALVATTYAFESAIFFFNQNKLWQYCAKVDNDSILKVSRAINLGSVKSKATPHGLQDRIEKTLKYYSLLK